MAEADRLGPLRAAKLRVLVGEQWGPDATTEAVTGFFPGGATLFEGGTGRAWVLIDDADSAGLGPALVWAGRHQVSVLHVLVDDVGSPSGDRPGPRLPGGQRASAVVARRASQWADPPSVWRVEGRGLVPAPPAPAPAEPALPAEVLAFADVLHTHGADPVVEHGLLLGEVLGLEVAQVVAGHGGWHLEVGVGRLDRDARAEMRPDEPDGAAVDEVVGVVRTWRRYGAPRHPANTLARERWLRAAIVAHPEVVGAVRLRPTAPPGPRRGLRQAASAPAAGVAADGRPVIVMCSTGVDVDVVPAAADARRLHAGDVRSDHRLVIVVPEGDDYPVTRSLAAALRDPAEVVTVGRDWPALTDPP